MAPMLTLKTDMIVYYKREEQSSRLILLQTTTILRKNGIGMLVLDSGSVIIIYSSRGSGG